MTTLSSVAVYAASSMQVDPLYFDAARRLGTALADAGIRLVYGAGKVGLMGALADAVLQRGGEVTGVIPQFMVEQGWCHEACTELLVTADMHERKASICRIADAMVALPGGIGTFEELLECLTWKQLGLHTKPVVILNTGGYYDPLLLCLDRMVSQRFMRPIHQTMYTAVSTPEEVLPALLAQPAWDASVRKQAQL